MIGIEGLHGPTRNSDMHSFTLLSYHDPASITWSWLIGVWFTRAPWVPWWKLVISFRRNDTVFRIPFVGMIYWKSQRKILRNR